MTSDATPGYALVIGQSNSPLHGVLELMNDVMKRVEDALRPLRTIASIADFLTGFTILRQALGAQPTVRFHNGNIMHLNDISMRTDRFLGFDILDPDLTPNDDVRSLIFVGPSGTKVQCFNEKDQEFGEGVFTLEAPLSMMIFIRNLGQDLNELPGITVDEDDTDDDKFNNSLTSIKFL